MEDLKPKLNQCKQKKTVTIFLAAPCDPSATYTETFRVLSVVTLVGNVQLVNVWCSCVCRNILQVSTCSGLSVMQFWEGKILNLWKHQRLLFSLHAHMLAVSQYRSVLFPSIRVLISLFWLHYTDYFVFVQHFARNCCGYVLHFTRVLITYLLLQPVLPYESAVSCFYQYMLTVQ